MELQQVLNLQAFHNQQLNKQFQYWHGICLAGADEAGLPPNPALLAQKQTN